MELGITRYRWLDWLIVATTAGAGWTLGSAIMAALLGLLSRGA